MIGGTGGHSGGASYGAPGSGGYFIRLNSGAARPDGKVGDGIGGGSGAGGGNRSERKVVRAKGKGSRQNKGNPVDMKEMSWRIRDPQKYFRDSRI